MPAPLTAELPVYRILALAGCCLILIPACGPAQTIPVARSAGPSRLVAQFVDPDIIAEDVVYDSTRHRFLVSSARRGGVYAIDVKGRVTLAIAPDTASWGTFALAIDRRRNTLWVTTAAFPGTARYAASDSAHSALLEYDLRTGRLLRRLMPPDTGPHALGDALIGPDGSLFLSDGFGGAVYVVDPGSAAMRPVVPARTFRSPQTPALAADGRHLYVPDYSAGIAIVDLSDGNWRWLRHDDSLGLKGIDGLYRVGRDLIAVQNGASPNRIVRLTLGTDDRIDHAVSLAGGGTAVDLNHAVMLGRSLYFIAQSGWDRMTDDGRFTPGAASQAPQLRMLPF